MLVITVLVVLLMAALATGADGAVSCWPLGATTLDLGSIDCHRQAQQTTSKLLIGGHAGGAGCLAATYCQ